MSILSALKKKKKVSDLIQALLKLDREQAELTRALDESESEVAAACVMKSLDEDVSEDEFHKLRSNVDNLSAQLRSVKTVRSTLLEAIEERRTTEIQEEMAKIDAKVVVLNAERDKLIKKSLEALAVADALGRCLGGGKTNLRTNGKFHLFYVEEFEKAQALFPVKGKSVLQRKADLAEKKRLLLEESKNISSSVKTLIEKERKKPTSDGIQSKS